MYMWLLLVLKSHLMQELICFSAFYIIIVLYSLRLQGGLLRALAPLLNLPLSSYMWNVLCFMKTVKALTWRWFNCVDGHCEYKHINRLCLGLHSYKPFLPQNCSSRSLGIVKRGSGNWIVNYCSKGSGMQSGHFR